MRPFPLATLLPWDVVDLIQEHVRQLERQHDAARTIQRRFLAWSYWAHARSLAWPAVRARLGARTVRRLHAYSGVRREWRCEAPCWASTTHGRAILREARATQLWGPRATRAPHAGDRAYCAGNMDGTDGAEPPHSPLTERA